MDFGSPGVVEGSRVDSSLVVHRGATRSFLWPSSWLLGRRVGLVGAPVSGLAVLMYQTSSLDTTLSKLVSSA